MKRKTTTRQISEALTSNLLTVTKAECYYKTSRITDLIESDKFLEDLQFLCEANVFKDCIGWTYQQDHRTGLYILEAGRCDAYSENIVTVYFRLNDGVKTGDIEKALLMKEED